MKSFSVCKIDTAISRQTFEADSRFHATIPNMESSVLETYDTDNTSGPSSEDPASNAIDAEVESEHEPSTEMGQTSMQSSRYSLGD